MQVDQNLIDQLNGKNKARHAERSVNTKGIANYIQHSDPKVGGFVDAYAQAPAYRKSSAELGMFADDTVIGGAGVYQKPGGEEQSIAEALENGAELTPEQRHNQMAVLANTASPEDFQKIREQGFNPSSADTNTIVTVTDKIKAALVEMGDYIKGYTDTLSREELTKITGNAALAERIVRSLKTHDLPVTEDNVRDSAKALERVKGIGGLSDTAIAYMMKNNLTPSISNLYSAQHMGAGAAAWGAGVRVDLSGMDDQIRKIVQESGLQPTKANLDAGKWLLSNQIPLTGQNLEYMQQLKSLSGSLAQLGKGSEAVIGKFTDAMAAAISEGGRPEDAMLVKGYTIQERAQNVYDVIHSATEEDLAYCIANNEPVTVENLTAAMNARSGQSAQSPEVAHVLEMAHRDAELGIGTSNPQLNMEPAPQGPVGANGLTTEEEEALAAKMRGGGPVEAGGMSADEMDQVVARMTMPPEPLPEQILQAAESRKEHQKVKGGSIDLTTDGRTEDANYRDPNRGNMINVTTENLEELGYAKDRDDYGVYDYSADIHNAMHATRVNNAPEFKGDFPEGYNDYLADYSDNTTAYPRGYSAVPAGYPPQSMVNPAAPAGYPPPTMGYPMAPAGYPIMGYPMMGYPMGPEAGPVPMIAFPMMGFPGMPGYGEFPDYGMMTARATMGQRRDMNQRISMITSQRQLEEARLVMSMEANQGLMRRGVAIDIRPLEQLVDDLRTQEFYYFQGLLQGNGIMATEERVNIFANTTRMITEMQYQPAYILDIGSSMSTIPKLHEAGAALQNALQQANQSYETMMTRPNEELGDSITKAFQNIDDILKDLDLELTDANRRAVRILSYNHTELTVENILKMKAADEEVQRTFKNLTPAVTMEMIRQNKNPMDMTIQEVNELANQIKREQPEQEVERFSKYLYKLEQNRQITEDQRSGYIGIYRLISQVEKSDGAAIGFLVNQGAEVTMRNLLTAVRSAQRGPMDYEIGDKVEGETPKNVSARIDAQIESAFHHNMIRDVAEEISPQKVMTITQEKLMDMSPEQLKEAVDKTPDDVLAEEAYAQDEYAGYAEALNATEDVYAFLDRYDVPNTMLNIVAATRLLKTPSQMFKDIWKGGGSHAVAEMKKQVLSRFGEALKNPEELAEAEEELAEVAENVLREMVVEEDPIRHIDVKEMRILSHQFRICARRAQEECYTVPMRIGSLITGVNLKVVRGKREKGLVDILFDNKKTGKLAASFEARDNDIAGFIAVDREVACNHFNENIDEIMQQVAGENMENVKLQIVYAPNVSLESYEMKSIKWERRQRANGEQAEEGPRNPMQTRRLYKIAENFLGAVQKLAKTM